MNKYTRDYLIHTFAMMGLFWGSCVLCSACGIALTDHYLLYIPYVLGGLSPTIASYRVMKKYGRVENLRQWLKYLFGWKQSILHYIMVFFLAAVFILCLCAVSGYTQSGPLYAIVFMLPMMLFGGGLEEAGWRGILQPELEKSLPFPVAAGTVAVIWWLWHLPLFFIQGVSQYGADFLAYGVEIVGLSFALASARKITGSTWMCILLHCIINSLHGLFMTKENILGSLCASAAVTVTACLFLYIHKRKQTKTGSST